MNLINFKNMIIAIIGVIGSFISYLLGGFDMALITLLLFMAIDYITGFIVAAVFHKSNKTQSGSLNSRAGWKGLCKKGITLLIVLVAARLDLMMGVTFIRDGVIIAYIVNELLSIIENAGLMGVPIPKVITKGIEALKKEVEI